MTDAPPHVLVVDDARDIREPLGQDLRRQGYRTTLAAGAAEARRALEAAVHLAILHVMMPGEDGPGLCRHLAARGGPPVILLTAMAEDADRTVGLEPGADDHVVKPFNPRELLARVRAVLRRVPPAARPVPSDRRRFGPWVHDPAAQRLTRADGGADGRAGGAEVALTSGESRLLALFLDRPVAVLSRAPPRPPRGP